MDEAKVREGLDATATVLASMCNFIHAAYGDPFNQVVYVDLEDKRVRITVEEVEP